MRLSWILLFLGIVLFAGFTYFYMTSRPRPVGEDNCLLDGVAVAHTVLLIDQSDPFNENDLAWVYKLIKDESRALQQYDRFSVLSVHEGTDRRPLEVFSRCSPGALRRFTYLTRNEREAEKLWKERFALDLEDRIRDTLSKQITQHSPLIEYFDAIVRRPDFSSEVKARRLVVISDMMQNSPLLSHYRDEIDWDNFVRRAGYVPEPKFVGVAVKIYLAQRSTGPTGEKLKEFWRRYFEEQGSAAPEYVIKY